MKKSLILLLFFAYLKGVSQSKLPLIIDSEEYEKLKIENKIPENRKLVNKKASISTHNDFKKAAITHDTGTPAPLSNSSCSCYIEPDNTYTLAFAPNDDASTSQLPIPFSFCLYGTNYNSLYINNNGNISFQASYYNFSSIPFPDPTYVMIAPFWADVDTRGVGSVRYKITPTAVYVNWVGVGYYNEETDKINTFQLIITDGNDPILPNGNNIAFCYGDMQWTTGSASDGINGFAGFPATTGINQGGNGGNYIQLGQFDQPGMAYDGGYGTNDGVDWLDNKSFYFNVCNSTNIAPIVSGFNNCDTLRICDLGDTLMLSGLFLPPEIDQTTTITVNLNGTADASIVNITNGSTATAQVQFIASLANAGNNTITFTATDNGSPAAVTVVNVEVYVDTLSLTNINPIITGDISLCTGSNSLLAVQPTTYDSYYWVGGSTTSSISVDSAGLYWVTAVENGCSRTTFVNVTEHSLPTPVITGDITPCSNTTMLTVDSLIYASYNWGSGNTNDSLTAGAGTYIVNVTDSAGCSATSPPVTVIVPLPIIITGITAICNGDFAVLTTTTPFVNYNWSNGSTNDSAVVVAGDYTVAVTDLNGCLITSDSFNVSEFNFGLNVNGVAPYCAGSSITLTALATPSSGASYLWSTSANTATISVNSGGSYTASVSYSNGCSKDTTIIVSNPNPLPTPVILGDLTSCKTISSILSVDSANLYQNFLWSNTDTTNSISVISGTFTISVTDANGCTAVSPGVTVVNSNPTVVISGNLQFCPNDTTILTATPSPTLGVSYIWSNSNTSQSITINSTGTYYVSAIYSDACNAFDTVEVSYFDTPNAEFTESPLGHSLLGNTVVFTDLSTILSDTIINWVWDFGDSTTSTIQSPTHVYEEAGTYTISLAVQSDNGCWDTITYQYIVTPETEVPNVFTPNGDGKNDLLAFKNLEYFPDTKLIIFNRWGNKIYESTDYKNNWDGNGHSNGVYYFILTYASSKDPVYGFFEIIR